MITITLEIKENKCSYFFNYANLKKKFMEFCFEPTNEEGEKEAVEEMRCMIQNFFDEVPAQLWTINFKETYETVVKLIGEAFKENGLEVIEL